MNEEYLSKLWNWSTSQDPTLEDRYTYDSWKQKISSNSEYQRKFYDWIQSRDETFSERRPYDQWTGMVSSKKKESTVSDGQQRKPITTSATANQKKVTLPSGISGSAGLAEQASFGAAKGVQVSPRQKKALEIHKRIEAEYDKPMEVPEMEILPELDKGVQTVFKDGEYFQRVLLQKQEESPFSLGVDVLSQSLKSEYTPWRKVDNESEISRLDENYFGGLPNKRILDQREYISQVDEVPFSTLMNSSQGDVVDYLNNYWSDKGITAYESGSKIEVVDFNGKTKVIDRTVDGMRELKKFMKSISQEEKVATERMTLPEYRNYQVEKYIEDAGSIGQDILEAEELVMSTIKSNIEDIKARKNQIFEDLEEIKKSIAANGGKKNSDINKMIAELQLEKETLYKDVKALTEKEKLINLATGIALEKKRKSEEKIGTFGGAFYNKLLEGITNTSEAEASLAIDIMPSILDFAGIQFMPESQYEKYKSDGKTDAEIIDISKKELKKDIIPDLDKGLVELIGSETTDAYINSEDRNMFEKALVGVAESIPAMVSGIGGRGMALFSMSAMSYAHIDSEMRDDPDFESVSENEKKLLAIPYALGMGYLERLGFTEMLSKNPAAKSMLNRVVFNALKKTKKGENIATAVKNGIDNELSRGLFRIAGGSIIEAETGAAQEVLNLGAKDVYALAKGERMFDDPTLFSSEGASQVGESSLLEGIGGFFMKGALETPVMISKGIKSSKVNKELAAIMQDFSSDADMKSLVSTKLKTQIMAGEITTDEAKNIMTSYDEVMGIMNTIPQGLKPNIDKAFDLLLEKKKIEKQIDGKDKALVKDDIDRISQINAELETLSKEQTDAIQEQTTGIVPDAERAEGIQEVEEEVRVTPESEVETETEEEVTGEDVSSKTLLQQEVEDMTSIFGTPDGKKPRFREEEEVEGEVELEQDIESVVEKMNAMPKSELIFTFPESGESVTNVNPVEESLSAIKLTDEQASELGYPNAKDISKPLQNMNGLPMIPAMSDILGAGIYEDSEGNPMEIDGGLLFNVLGKNKNAAWAGVDFEGANEQLNAAIELYKAHKALFEQAWKDGRLPNGHVPMAVMRMGDGALDSNEAVYRFVKPTIDKAKNQEEAMNIINELIEGKTKVSQESQSGKNTVASALRLQEFVSKNNITTVSQLIDAVIADANKRAKGDKDTLSLPNRTLLSRILFTEGGKKNVNQSALAKSMFENDSDRAKLTFQTIYKSIGEKSMLDRNQGDVVSIVGIDVLNPEVIEVEHGNYGYGPKGRIIQLVSNPMHGIDVFPEWKAKTTRVYKKDKKGRLPDENKVKSQTGGAFFTDKIFRGAKAILGDMSKQDILIGKLRTALPNVYVAKSKAEFDAIMSRPDVRSRVSKGNKVLGLTVDGRIYLNPEDNTLETPIHEFGHIWIDYLRSDTSSRKGTKLYEKGIELAKKTDLYKTNLEKYGDPELAAEETLVEMMATKGKMIVDAAERSKFMNWLNAVFKYIKENFTSFEDLKVRDIKSMSLEDFIDTSLGTLLMGKAIDKDFNPSDVNESTRARFSMYSDSTPMAQIIREARSEGFSDEAIAEYLKSVRKFKVKDIKEAMKVHVDLLTNLPNEFGNVEGGVEQGRKIFLDVKSKLNRFATSGPRGGRAGRVTKTMGEIRAKAQELLKANPIFQEQSETVQMQLLNAFDRTLETRANRNVQSEINAIRNNLKQRAIGAKELSDVKRSIRNLIRKSLPKSNTYTKKQIVDLVTIINNASSKTILADIERISNEVEKQRAKMKKSAMREILKIVSRKPKKTSTGKRRGSGVPAELQSLFTQAESIVEAVIENDTDSIDSIKEELSKAEADGTLADVVDKFVNEEKLSNTERVLMNKLISIDTFSDMNNMTLEEVEQLLSDVKNMRAVGIENTKAKKLERLLDRKKLKSEADSQIRETNKVLFNMDGTVKSKNRRRMDKVMIRQSFKEGKIWTGFKKLYSEIKYFSVLDIREFLRNHMSHLGTLSSLLDDIPNGKTFFTDNVYKPLNRMDESAKMGYFRQKTKLDELANSIDGITKGYKQVISKLRTGTHELMLRGEREIFNADQLLRIYALSKNDVQRKKLAKMGFNAKVIEDIKDICGPEAIQFADNLVDYFSNEYFDSINNVYSSVNDVNLGFVENYFPTMTDTGKVDGKMLENGDFNGIFNAETSPALKERTATEGEILLGYDFTDVVESHITQMEKYKAYAEGVKKMNDVFKIESVDALLTESGMKQVYKASINYAITPNAGTKERRNVMSRVLTKFTGFALAFKVIQIPKQATSFINAYEDYQFLPNRKVPVLDFIMFAADTAVTLATLPKQIRNAYKMSANVRDRLLKGIEGDVYGLESGSSTFTRINKRDDIYAKAVRALKTGAAGPTVLGDIMGVMGYMTNYRRDIRNGMSMEEALEKFNDYNATQQSRRGTEKISMQQNNNFTSRAFTMFGSTSFLQLNKVISSADNIWKAMKKGKPPKGKDVRSLAINYAVANVLFVGAANLAKFIKGDDEDREDAIRAMKEAASGMSIISNVPLIGAAYETAYYHIIGKRKPISDVTNPFISAYWKINRGLKEGSIWKATQPIAEIALGAQVDPFIGLYNTFGGDFNEDDVYAMLGISKSYRPSGGGSGGGDKSSDLKTYKPKPLTKTEMKEQMPEVYEMIYGENSDIYKTEQMVKDIEKSIQDDIDRQLKDAGVK